MSISPRFAPAVPVSDRSDAARLRHLGELAVALARFAQGRQNLLDRGRRRSLWAESASNEGGKSGFRVEGLPKRENPIGKSEINKNHLYKHNT